MCFSCIFVALSIAMKKFFILLACGIVHTLQAQVTLQSSDMPITNYSAFKVDSAPIPLIGSNINWDYSSYPNTTLENYSYTPETDTFFINANCTYSDSDKKLFNSQFYYDIANKYNSNTQYFGKSGHYVPQQAYSLQAISGGATDSLKIPEQKYILDVPSKAYVFPMTMGSHWESQSRRIANFTLTVMLYGMNNTPAQHAYTTFRSDSVVGWGKMTVYTNLGPSIPYDVLMVKTKSYTADSFYLSGAPAPAALLQAFGVSQGQILTQYSQYNFYRAGSGNYLMRFSYRTDTTFSTLTSIYVALDGMITSKDKAKFQYSTFIYPNPSENGMYQLFLNGYSTPAVQYSVLDIQGKEVQKEEVSIQDGHFTIQLSSTLPKGNYIIHIQDLSGNKLATEKVIYQ